MRLIMVDIGNSAIKMAGPLCPDLQANDVPLVRRLDTWSEFDFCSLSDEPARWIVSSVNDTALQVLTTKLNQGRPQDKILLVAHDNVGLTVSTEEPARVGVDRLVACRAAWQLNRTAVVVDAGTAVTIDAVTGTGEFLGGLIYPGPDASFRQLSEQASALPDLDYASRQNKIARWQSIVDGGGSMSPWQTNTADAIAAGIYRTQSAGLDRGVCDFVASIDGPVQVYLTGGAMPELLAAAASLKVRLDWIETAVHDPNLVLVGLMEIAKAG